MRDSAVMISSTIPSAKYSCSGSPLRLAKGKTAIEGLSRRAAAGLVRSAATGRVSTGADQPVHDRHFGRRSRRRGQPGGKAEKATLNLIMA